MKKYLALLLAITVALPGCATARASSARFAPPPKLDQGRPVDPAIMADYLRHLPVGSRIRLTRANGDELRGTLMKNDGDPVYVQRRARIPEAPVEVPLNEILAVELDVAAKSNAARTAAISATAATASVLGVLLVLSAIFAD